MDKSNKTYYDIEYAKRKLKRIPLDVTKEKYQEIKLASQSVNESINGYIKKAIDYRMNADNLTKDNTSSELKPNQKDTTTLEECIPIP